MRFVFVLVHLSPAMIRSDTVCTVVEPEFERLSSFVD